MTDKENYDVLVIGAGIAGMETSLNLGEMGFKVLLVERSPSIGGTMILLSKVFPTLDCASCISTPKMASVMHHPNITPLTYASVDSISRDHDDFEVQITRKPRYVKEDLCTVCGQCEQSCPVVIPDQFNFGLVGRKAVYIPFSTASPRLPLVDLDNCVLCGVCERTCPASAIDFSQQPESFSAKVKSVVIATGFNLFPAHKLPNIGSGVSRNVITAMQMERLLSPTRPYNTVLRPSDGKIPSKIAYILCAGSRDRSLGNPICSQVCCMYSIKQAELLSGVLPLVEVSIFYIDIRAFGKGYDEFYEQAKSMGIRFVKGKVSKIESKGNGDLILKYEDIENSGKLAQEEFDLAVLAVGLLPSSDVLSTLREMQPAKDDANFIGSLDSLHPAMTSVPGIFVAGTAYGPKDIPDSVNSSGDAASEAAAFMQAMVRIHAK